MPRPRAARASAGCLNRISPASGSGLIATMRAPALGLLERREHARVVGARVLADDEDQVGLREVVERHVPLPTPIVSPERTPLDSWHMFEQSGRLLVPNCADEQLVEERGLVAGAPRGVERRLVGRGQRGQLAGDEAKASSQAIGLVVRRRPGGSTGSVSRPCWPSQWSVCSASSATGCAAKNSASTRRTVASSATALAPFSQSTSSLVALAPPPPPFLVVLARARGLLHVKRGCVDQLECGVAERHSSPCRTEHRPVMRHPFTRVPFVDHRSVSDQPPSSRRSSAWWRDTVG